MENKRELFDLKREKRELDAFLTTIAEPAASLSAKDVAATTEALSASAENKPASEDTHRAPSGLELEEMPVLKLEEEPVRPIQEEKALLPDENEFPSENTDTVSLPPIAATPPERETAPSSLMLEEENKPEALPEISDAPGIEPLERFAAATPFEETAKFDEPVLPETPPPEEKIILTKPAPEKKKSKANAYDFAPEKKSVSTGKRIWILIILLIALLVGYLVIYPEPVSKAIEIIKPYIPVFKTDQSATSTSVQGIKLINVRERLVYNVRFGKSVRVIEGLAENLTTRPVSRIKIAANLYSADGSVLASTESFCGNMIIDEKLESLDPNGILAALKDVKTIEDRIPPKGQMPFMIVFTVEPAGVFRLSVSPVDFKKH
jgi:hypothetical protein